MASRLFTSESVSEGHPDKVCDQISDSILDAMLAGDANSRVACETSVTTGLVLLAGEITTSTYVDVQEIARETIRDIGYVGGDMGFDADGCAVITALHSQSADIAMGVDEGEEKAQGAGDQGMMFGYASNETPELMPLPIMLSHQLVRHMAELRKAGTLDYLRPDSKSQVTVEYVDDKPVRVDTVVISTQHNPDISQEQIREDIIKQVIEPIMPEGLYDASNVKIHVNPTGRFVIGGPHGDAGLTGRKIIVDTYGGMGRHGGGAFSGKDPSKVDRSAAYAARWIAKNVVAGGAAERAEVQLSYAIGVAEPTSVNIDTFGTSPHSEAKLIEAIRDTFDLTPAGIISGLDLRKPKYRQTAAYGHFGRDEEGFTWELTPHADVFKGL